LKVFVLHWNAAAKAAATVRSLLRSSDVRVHVTVIDNDSRSEEWHRLESCLPRGANVLRMDRNLGFAGAANVALSRVLAANGKTPEWFVLAAHDVEVRPDSLRRLLDAAVGSPHHGVLGPVFWDAAWERRESTGGRWDVASGAWRLTGLPEDGWQVVDRDWLVGALLLIRTDCARLVGGFDERLFAYCEDVDFCLRARDAGWQVGVVPAASARESGATVGHLRQSYLITRNSLLLSRWRGGPGPLAVRAAGAYFHSLRSGVGSVLLWRTNERRAISRQFALGQFRGTTAALLGRTGSGSNGWWTPS
jgi:GT2 family glycosyltransferase